MLENFFALRRNAVRRGRPFSAIHPANIPAAAKRSFIALAIVACWLMVLATASAERSVTLAWYPSADASAIGYRVYTLEENTLIAASTNVGGMTQVTVPGLKEGLRYTFTVTSYNAAGIESVPSNDAVFVVPVPLQLLPATTPAGGKRLQFPAAPGRWYELQASTDLKNWTTIWQTGVAITYAWTGFTDPQSATLKSRFYRLQVH